MPELDREVFNKRIKRLYSYWQNAKDENEKMEAICVVAGGDNENSYYKTTALQQWLFGVEISDTAIIFLKDVILFVASQKKMAFFKQIQSGKENEAHSPKYAFIVREKSDAEKSYLKEASQVIAKNCSSSPRVGWFPKDKYEGDFIKDWWKSVDQSVGSIEKCDASALVASILSVKDDAELTACKRAAETTNRIYSKYLKDQIINIIDGEKKVKHTKLSEGVENAINESKFVANQDKNFVETCYPAIIQSGGKYSLKFSAQSERTNVHYGTIICALGFRYKNYCSNIVRTIMVEPNDECQANYKLLLRLEEELIDGLRDGVRLNELYDKVKQSCAKEKPELSGKLTPNMGFLTGIEFREPTYLISTKCQKQAKAGMVFQVSIGFTDLTNTSAKDSESKTYALFIGDTVQVRSSGDEAGGAATLLTLAKKKIENVGIFINDDEDSDESDSESKDAKSKKKGKSENFANDLLTRTTRGAVLENKTRSDNSTEKERKEHQKVLGQRLNQEAKDRLLNKKGEETKEKVRKVVTAYRTPSQMPYGKHDLQDLKIYVDKGHETIILPVYGMPTPFHISTLKNLSSSVEGDYTYLRLNFFHPGAATINRGGAADAAAAPVFQHQDCVYIKEVTYRASNLKESGGHSAPSTNLGLAFKYIKDMQKEYKEKENEEKEKEGMVKQDSLILSKNAGKPNPKLKDLFMRPNIVQKRTLGSLEAHTNGFLYTSLRGDKVEILYNNIKHAIFQGCDSEIIILVHFHLKNAVMFGKKKNLDIQFYTEVGEVITDLGKHNRGGDRDDMIAEQAEKEMRRKLNGAFRSFIDKVETLTKNQVTFEKPSRDLGFNGTPFRSMVLLQPTAFCLINVTEMPPFVLTLDQIELVHFERVSFHLKNFDMVFIPKDYTKKVTMITAVPMSQLDQVKEWLNSMDIKYTEGLQNFNWPKIMKTITDDPEGFFDQGGWNFLEAESDQDKADDSEISDEEDDAFEPSDSEEFSGSESDDSSDYSSDDSDDDSDSDASGSGSGSSEESGKDWSDLEEEARRDDMNVSENSNDGGKRKGNIIKTSASKRRK